MKKPLINSDCARDICNESYASNQSNGIDGKMRFEGGNIIFCKIDHVLRIFEKLRLTRNRIVLVTGEGDLPCDEFRQKYMPENVVRWFATNVTKPHPKVNALPLGLGSASDPVTLSEDQIVTGRYQVLPRQNWLYVNFRPQTNPSVRQPVYDHFERLSESESWITMEKCESPGGNDEFLQNLLTHRFVLCPPGNGVDTHRMWESLAAGAIPVVLRSRAMEPFKALPILFVDRYEEVTLGMLEDAVRRISPATLDEPMLQSTFWVKKIEEASLELKNCKIMSWREWISESIEYVAGMVKRKLIINHL
jgi:hypothetical protein